MSNASKIPAQAVELHQHSSMKLNLTFLRRVTLLLGMTMVVSTVSGTDVPKNLGNDLDKLVESNITLKTAQRNHQKIVTYNGFASERAALASDMAIREQATNKYLVDIHPSGRVPFEKLKENLLKSCPSLRITATDPKYRRVGVIEGFISIDHVATVANNKGVTSVQLGIRPYLKRAKGEALSPNAIAALTLVGTAFDQGVTQHRVDKVSTLYSAGASMSLDGNGISVGCLSDSYDTRTAAPHAPADVTNFDLPGAAGNPYNTTPVFLLHDAPGAETDEARALCQVVYKMAPRAKIGVSTANGGELNFANSMRALAGINSADFPNASTQGFAANVLVDDVGYFDEPWYEDGMLGDAVNDINAAGKHYFSSASNNIGTNGYTSPLRWVANGTGNTSATNTALANTNIDLTGVPAELYAGGFHNFNPKPGSLDVALTWALPSGGQLFVMQWDDPYDQNTQANLDPVLYHNSGTNTGAQVPFTVPNVLTAGELYEVDVTQTSGDFDAIVTITDPSNVVIVDHQDTTIDEIVRFFAPVTGGNYHILVDRFAATTGNFDVDLFHASGFAGGPLVTTDVNLLAFNSSGAYVPASSIKSNNFATNQPIELATIARANAAGLQFLISRRNVPASGGPTHIRLEDGGNGVAGIAPVEYFTYNTVTTGGHDSARGASGVAAYSVFRPSRPETFTSPGPAVYYFDGNNNRLATPEVRLQPRIAAADAANTSFFAGSDSTSDGDGNRNFSGTSASAPHAAACAALVLQAKGGPASVTPDQMRNLLQNSTFQHDLDPMFVRGTASAGGGTVNISVNSDSSSVNGIFGLTSGVGLQDSNSWKLSYTGPAGTRLTDLTFNPAGTAAAAGNPTGGNNGLDSGLNYFSNNYPGMVFMPATKAFTTGTFTGGLAAADVAAPTFSNAAPLPSGANQWWTMAMTFPTNNFTNNRSVTFTVGRGQQHSSVVGTFATPQGGAPFAGPNSGLTVSDATADLLGGAVQIPENTAGASGLGMAFSGHIFDGATSVAFSGNMTNAIGSGYTVLDGYGFINMEAAATGSTATPGAVTLSSVVSRKTHGAAGNFDIVLPAVECRDGGANGDYTLIFTFSNTINSAGGAVVSEGSASVANTSVAGNTVTVNLTNVINAQRVTVNVVDVHDSAGNVSAAMGATLRVLIGDTSNNGSVSGTDISQTKLQAGNAVGAGNFREDIVITGSINGTDVGAVKLRSGTAVP
jgi:subtilase family protein